MFNSTIFTFEEEATVIALSFVLSLLSCALLAAVLFGYLAHVQCPGVPASPEFDEWACCVIGKYAAYRWCPSCCCSDWRRHLKARIAHMREELMEQEMEEVRKLEEGERVEREEREKKWHETEKSLKNK